MGQSAPHSRRTPVLALFLIGAGLVILGGIALILLPDKLSESKPEAEFSAVPNQVSYAAAEVSLNDLEGNPVKLSDLRGKVVLVNHWAVWCPPCRQEMPALQAFYEDHRASGFTMIAINQGETLDTIQSFVEEQGLTFPVWQDPAQTSLATFGYDGLPSSYVVDKDGTVRLVWIGAISQEMLEKHVAPLIEN